MGKLSAKVESVSVSDGGDKKSSKPRSKKSRKMKVSNQIPAKRRREIERALDAHDPSRPEWDRMSGAKQHRFFGKRIKPGSIRQIGSSCEYRH